MAVLDQFLTSISKFLKIKDPNQLRLFLRVEPPLPDQFLQLGQELRSAYTDGEKLERHIEKLVPYGEDGNEEEFGGWPAFWAFLKEYLEYWRDVKFDDLLGTHLQLSGVANACITALSNGTYGIIMLPATIQLCSTLARLAMMLDKRPDLTRGLRKMADLDQGETQKTLVESTAELIQRAFTVCLTARTANKNGVGRDGKPEGKKIGIYSFANMVLRLLFQCRKTTLANQLFTNISQNSPPIGLYPASQRVTFLYYLGRYHFANSHFYYAQLCLQSAYDQCHSRCLSQKRLITVYLVSSNMIIGRFPSRKFYARPETADILEKFMTVGRAIQTGNMQLFKASLGAEYGNDQYFFQKGVLLPLLSRCEALVWRSLARRVFLLTYQFPTDPNSRKAPTMDLSDMLAAAHFSQKLLEGYHRPQDSMISMQSGRSHPNALFMKPPDLIPPPTGPKVLKANQGMIFGNNKPDMWNIEATMASLVQQGLLRGFISHTQGRFAILGSKQRGGPLLAGFPQVAETIRERAQSEGSLEEVPGWVQTERASRLGGVVDLSGIARAVGVAT